MRKHKHTKSLIFLKCMAGIIVVGIFIAAVTALFTWPGWLRWVNYELAHAGLSEDDARASTNFQLVTQTDKALEGSNIPSSSKKDDWKTLQEKLLKKAERRSYENKMMTRELVQLVRAIIITMAAITIIFPLTIWWLSRRRILGLSKLSSELAATLVSVEERQVKLSNVLQELKGEIEYLQITPSPDLKKLVEQAEMYIEQNKSVLEQTTQRERTAKSDYDT